MAINLATCFVELTVSAKGISADIAKEFANAQDIGDKAGKQLGTALADQATKSLKSIDSVAQTAGADAGKGFASKAEAAVKGVDIAGAAQKGFGAVEANARVAGDNAGSAFTTKAKGAVSDGSTALVTAASEGFDKIETAAKQAGEDAGKGFSNSLSSKVDVDNADVRKKISDPLEDEGKKAGTRAGDGFGGGFGSTMGKVGGILAGVFAATAVVDWGKQVVGAASDLNEVVSKTATVFGEDQLAPLRAWGQEADTAFGLSEEAALAAASSYGFLLQGTGLAQEATQGMSTDMVQLAADMASFNNTPIDQALEAIRSGLVGESEPLRAFGITLSANTIAAYAMSKGLVAMTVDEEKLFKATQKNDKSLQAMHKAATDFGEDSPQFADALKQHEFALADIDKIMEGQPDNLDAATKAQATYGLILEQAGVQAGDFERTSEGLANQQRILSAQFENVKAKIGQALLPIILKVVNFLSDKGIPAFKTAGKAIGAFVSAFKDQDVTSDGWIGTIEKIAGVARDAFDGLAKAFGFLVDNKEVTLSALAAIGGVVAGLIVSSFVAWASAASAAALATLTAAAPFIAIGVAIAAVGAGFVLAYTKVEWFRTAVDAVKKWIVEEFVPAMVATGEWIVAAAQAAWPTIQAIIVGTFDAIKAAIEFVINDVVPKLVAAYDFVEAVVKKVWPGVQAIVTNAVDVVVKAIELGVKVITAVWSSLDNIVGFLKTFVIDPILVYVDVWWTVFSTAVQVGVAAVQTAFKVIGAIVEWLRNNVWDKITAAVGVLFDVGSGIVGAITTGVGAAMTAFHAIGAIVQWTFDHIITPITNQFDNLRSALANSFQLAVDAIRKVWETLKDVAMAPVRFVVNTVYNDGIRKVWNFVASKIGLGELSAIPGFATGGFVPGTGNKDSVPIMATPGEFIIPKKPAAQWGPGVLEFLRDGPKGTVDPGIFGYAQGGYVHSPAETLDWVKQHDDKAYQFPMVGPGTFDCSGFMSAITNYIFGRNPYSRLFSTGSFAGGGVAGFAAGPGDYPKGFTLGVRLPYTTNQQGATVGHMAGTLQDVNVEAGGHGVQVGPPAQGAMGFPLQFNLPGYGGLSEDEKAIAKSVIGLGGIEKAPGGNPFADAISGMFKDLPKKVASFLTTQLPGALVKAIKDVVGDLFESSVDVSPGLIATYKDAINGMATGGVVKGGQGGIIARVGEGMDDELITRLPAGWDISDILNGGGASNTYHFSTVIEGNVYGDEALRKTLDERDRLQRDEFVASPR